MTDKPVVFDANTLMEISKNLAALRAAARNIRDRYYKGKRVDLDGYTFTNCCFERCELYTQTGAFALTECRLINCAQVFGPNAVRIIRLFHTGGPYTQFDEFNPQTATDGTVTIT